MTLDQLFRYLNFISTKENSGLTYTPTLFNLNVPIVVREIYDEHFEEYERTGVISDVLNAYEVVMGDNSAPLEVGSNGLANKPTDYYHQSSLAYKVDSDNGVTVFQPIGVCTDDEWRFLKSSKLRPPTKDYPICTFRATTIEFLPKDLQYVDFTYLSQPESPVYDYYIDQYGDMIFMPEGSQHYLSTGEQGSEGQTTHLAGGEDYTVGLTTAGFPLAPKTNQYHYFTDGDYTYPPLPDPASVTGRTWKYNGTNWFMPVFPMPVPAHDVSNYVDSKTVELKLPAKAHQKLARYLLRDIGISLRDDQLLAYSQLLKAQNK